MNETNREQPFIEYLKTIDTPTISNAIEQLHLLPVPAISGQPFDAANFTF